ncbi:MAG: hypothetical protein WCF67_17855 [Chitinophagaceae bacterium]
MKKFAWISILILAVAGIIYYLTNQNKKPAVNTNFTRNYSPSAVEVDALIEAPCNIDVLTSWRGTLIGYSIGARRIVQMDSAGNLLKRISYDPPGKRGIIHSMSIDSNYVYCFDINNRSVYRTDFKDSLSFADSLPRGVMGAVKNYGPGYTLQQSNSKSKDAFLRAFGEANTPSDTIYAFASFKDWGVSHRGQLFKDADNTSVFFLPFYNADVLRYDYASGKIHHIQSVDKNPVRDMSTSTPMGRILSSKAPVTNRIATANKNYLFILSYARSAGDPHANQPIVDVYAAITGNYCYSFPVPGITGMKISSIACIDDRLAISFNHKITLLSFNEKANCK